MHKPQDVVRMAETLLQTRYAGATYAVAAGSIINGTGTVFSDLDMIVVFANGINHAYRESFMHEDLPVEVFIHDHETLQAFIDDDFKNGDGLMAHMLTTGVVVPDTAKIDNLLAYCKSRLETEKLSFSQEQMEAKLYHASDLIDDLRGHRPRAEHLSTLYELYGALGELMLIKKGVLVSAGKHLARKLDKVAPDFQKAMIDLIYKAHTEEISEKTVAAWLNLLDQVGGYFFDGYKRDAPKTMRTKPEWSEA